MMLTKKAFILPNKYWGTQYTESKVLWHLTISNKLVLRVYKVITDWEWDIQVIGVLGGETVDWGQADTYEAAMQAAEGAYIDMELGR